MDLYPIILGIIQGISEWLPISSKTQILIASNYLLNINPSIGYTFGLFMEIGTVFSALLYFRRDIYQILKDKKILYYIIIAIIFTGLIGAPLYIISDKLLENAYNASIPMIILGLILILDGIYIYYTRNKIKIKDKKDLNLRDIIIIGIVQGLAALPGVSRSGITVSTMLLMEYDPKFAFSLSYILYIPAALGASLLTILASKSNIMYVVSNIGYYGILTAMIVSFIVGYLTIGILMKLAKSKKIYYIDYILGSIAIIISLIGLIYG